MNRSSTNLGKKLVSQVKMMDMSCLENKHARFAKKLDIIYQASVNLTCSKWEGNKEHTFEINPSPEIIIILIKSFSKVVNLSS